MLEAKSYPDAVTLAAERAEAGEGADAWVVVEFSKNGSGDPAYGIIESRHHQRLTRFMEGYPNPSSVLRFDVLRERVRVKVKTTRKKGAPKGKGLPS